jgi:hypothetical protein
MQKQIIRRALSLALTIAVLLSLATVSPQIVLAEEAGAEPDGTHTIAEIFPDPALAEWVADKLSTDTTATPTAIQLAEITGEFRNQSGLKDIAGLRHLTGLSVISLRDAPALTGFLNEFTGLTNLTQLWLIDVDVTGTLAQLPIVSGDISLQRINVTGSLETLPVMPKLHSLYLLNINITGSLETLPVMPELVSLYLGNMDITGSLALPVMPELWTLGLSNINVTGSLDALPAMPKLQALWLYDMDITGSLALPVLLELQTLELSGLGITGPLETLSAMPKLKTLSLRALDILPSEIGSLSGCIDLEGLYIRNCENLVVDIGDIPNLQKLKYLTFQSVPAFGDIGQLPQLPAIETLVLECDNIGGDIANLPAWPNIKHLEIDKDTVYGDIGSLPYYACLEYLRMGSSNVSGDIANLKVPSTAIRVFPGKGVYGDVPNAKLIVAGNSEGIYGLRNQFITLPTINFDGSPIAVDVPVKIDGKAILPRSYNGDGAYENGQVIWQIPSNAGGTLSYEFFNPSQTYSGTVSQTYTVAPHTVTFLDWDAEVLDTQTVDHGSAATGLANPSRAGHTFSGWDKTFGNITEDLTVTAQYTANAYTVTFKDHDGTELKTESVTYGAEATAPANPDRPGHTFTGWDKTFDNITADLTVTARYTTNEYTVTFKDHDGTELKTESVTHGGIAIAPADPARPGYIFTGWDKAFDNITEDLTVTAQYTTNAYTVTFKDHDGTTLKTESVTHGAAATAPADPARPGYTFTGWDKSFDSVTEDLTVTAQYTLNDDTTIIIDRPGNYSFGNGEVTGDIYINCDDVHIDNLVLHGNLYATGKNIYIWGLYTDGNVELNSTGTVMIWGGYSTSGYNNYGGYEGDVSFGNIKSLVTGWNDNLNTIVGNLTIKGSQVSIGDFGRSMNVNGDLDIHAAWSTLTYVIVKGKTTVSEQVQNGSTWFNNGSYPNMGVYGGGYNSIHLKDVTVGSLEVNKVLKEADDQPVRVVFEDDTEAAETLVKSAAIVENASDAGKAAKKVIIETTQEVELRGFLSEVEVTDAAAVKLAENAVIETLTVTKDAAGAALSGAGRIETAVISETLNKAAILGEVSVDKTETLNDGSGKSPDTVTTPSGNGGGSTPPPAVTTPPETDDSETPPTSTGTAAAGASAFADGPAGSWFGDAVSFVSELGIMGGSGNANTFKPQQTMTRAMLITALARYDGVDTGVGETWYSAAVSWGIANDVTDGNSLNDDVTREQIVTMLWRYAGQPQGDASFDGISDAADISPYAADAFKWAIDAGIITGYDDKTVKPQKNATRAEVATILMRFVSAAR